MLGSGILNIYPPEHVELARAVRAAGALHQRGPAPFAAVERRVSAPQSNYQRHVVGRVGRGSVGTIGSVITARHAYEQGRDVFAVPGRIDSRLSQGCHRLIRDGARLVESVDDILEELGPLVAATTGPSGQTVHHPAELSLNEIERQILAAVETQATSIDHVIAATNLPVAQVLSTVSVLEMRRLLRRVSGNSVLRP